MDAYGCLSYTTQVINKCLIWAPRQQEVMVLLCHDVAGAPASPKDDKQLQVGFGRKD